MSSPDRTLPTVAEVLALAPMATGEPEVLAGHAALHRTVRWVHVAPQSGTQRLLLGGELLLTTGESWPASESDLRTYASELAAAGIAGHVLELGNRYATAPQEMVRVCADLDLPFVVLHREVRFVSITEAVHSQIIESQTGALRERDRVHRVFAELNRRGCSTPYLLENAAHMLGKPIVLEDLNYRAVGWSLLGREAATLLNDWAASSRRAAGQARPCPPPYAHTSLAADEGWLRTPVEAHGQRWGTLVALECSSPPGIAEVVLENAALALSVGRLSSGHADEWTALGQRHLIECLLDGSYVSQADLQAAFEAAGLRVAGRDLVAVARRAQRGGTAEYLDGVRSAAVGLDFDVVCSPWVDEPGTTAVLVLSFRRERTVEESDLLALLEGRREDAASCPSVIAVGSVVGSLSEVMTSAEEAMSLLQATPAPSAGNVVVYESRLGALSTLLSHKRSDPAVQAFVERALGPLLVHDAQHQGDLIEVARACAEHPTNRKRAAAACHLSRSVFYQRIQKIEHLLGADLDDGRTLAMLHVALLAYRQQNQP